MCYDREVVTIQFKCPICKKDYIKVLEPSAYLKWLDSVTIDYEDEPCEKCIIERRLENER